MSSTRLGDLVDDGSLKFSDGYRTKRSELADTGYRILRAAEVDAGIFPTGYDFVARVHEQAIGDKQVRPGDVVLTTKGTVGRVAFISTIAEPMVYSPQLCFFRTRDHGRLQRRYLGYWFKSPHFLQQASHLMSNTDMAPYLSLRDIRSLMITLPPLPEQQAIAAVLGALDDKIAANTALARTADNLARVKFAAMTKEVKAPLSQLARFVNGKAFTKGASGAGRVVIRIAELNSGIGGSTVYNDIDVADDHLARAGDLLFAWSGSLTVHRWFRAEGIINQHIFKVIPADGCPIWLVHQVLLHRLEEFRAIAADKATTMGHIQRRHLDDTVAVPDASLVARESGLMTGLWQTALQAEQENLTLATLRDTLLPSLMSGRLRVKDAERQVEDAV